jgi:hypothetical protein
MSAPTPNTDDVTALAAFRQALLALSTSQSYEIDGRTVTRADLPAIRDTITWLEKRMMDTTERGFAYVNFNNGLRGFPGFGTCG